MITDEVLMNVIKDIQYGYIEMERMRNEINYFYYFKLVRAPPFDDNNTLLSNF